MGMTGVMQAGLELLEDDVRELIRQRRLDPTTDDLQVRSLIGEVLDAGGAVACCTTLCGDATMPLLCATAGTIGAAAAGAATGAVGSGTRAAGA